MEFCGCRYGLRFLHPSRVATKRARSEWMVGDPEGIWPRHDRFGTGKSAYLNISAKDRSMLNPQVFRSFDSRLAVQGRYNQNLFPRVLTRSLQGIAERPLPCNYNVV